MGRITQMDIVMIIRRDVMPILERGDEIVLPPEGCTLSTVGVYDAAREILELIKLKDNGR